MRYVVWLIGTMIVGIPVCVPAEAGPGGAAAGETAQRMVIAQADAQQADVELSAPEDNDSNIFKHLKIDLLDLQRLGEEVQDRLVGEPLRLTLNECIQMALESNQDILVTGYEPILSETDLQAARGEFDPILSATINNQNSVTPASPSTKVFSGLSSIDLNLTDYRLSLAGKLFWGTQYSLDVFSQREVGTFTRPSLIEGPQAVYTSDVTLTLTQPILRGFGTGANRVRIRTARNARGISGAQFELAVLNSIGDTIKAYWDLVGAIEQLKVRQESWANAMRVVGINEQRFKIGTAAAIEVLQAKAGAAARQSDLITARTSILDAEDILKNLIGLYEDDLLSSKSIVPIERPNPVEVEWELESSMRTALDKRPEIRGAELQVENARLELKRARNERWPQLDATGSYGQNSNEFDFIESFGELGDRRDGRTWTVGLQGSIPIGNRTARGGYRRAKLLLRQQEQRLKQTKQQVMLSVRLAVHSVASSEILIESNKQTRTLQEANVAAEEKRLRLGVTTSQEVLEIQEDLTAARTQEVQSEVNFEKSLVDLQVAEGTLLENVGIIPETAIEER